MTPQDIVKTLIFNADGKACAVLIRGDQEVNEIKVKNYLGAAELEMAMTKYHEGNRAPRWFAGAIKIKTRVIAIFRNEHDQICNWRQ